MFLLEPRSQKNNRKNNRPSRPRARRRRGHLRHLFRQDRRCLLFLLDHQALCQPSRSPQVRRPRLTQQPRVDHRRLPMGAATRWPLGKTAKAMIGESAITAPIPTRFTRCGAAATRILVAGHNGAGSCPWRESDAWAAGCQSSTTHDEASTFCAGVGGRLCTLQELERSCVQGSGCRYNEELLWSSTKHTERC